MTGTSTIRDRNRSGSGTPARGTRLKKKMLMTTTIRMKVVPQRVWAVPKASTSSGVSGPVGLVGADRLVLGAVIGEDAPDVAHHPDRGDVGDEDPQPDQALDGVRREVAVGGVLREGRQEERQQEEEADGEAEAEDHGQRDRALAELDVLALGRDRRRAHQHARADHEGLVQQEDPAQERDLDQLAIGRERGRKRLRHGPDLARTAGGRSWRRSCGRAS